MVFFLWVLGVGYRRSGWGQAWRSCFPWVWDILLMFWCTGGRPTETRFGFERKLSGEQHARNTASKLFLLVFRMVFFSPFVVVSPNGISHAKLLKPFNLTLCFFLG